MILDFVFCFPFLLRLGGLFINELIQTLFKVQTNNSYVFRLIAQARRAANMRMHVRQRTHLQRDFRAEGLKYGRTFGGS